mmetsp:Transcript_92599/g.261546  ORF Transcript_92599/g.261546 Transcript_92599/m.261546 type:complete len:434 (-) Transcript_92599:61-1362(-)
MGIYAGKPYAVCNDIGRHGTYRQVLPPGFGEDQPETGARSDLADAPLFSPVCSRDVEMFSRVASRDVESSPPSSRETERSAGAKDVDDAKEAELTGLEIDIPEDAYGAAILAIVKDLPRVIRREKAALALACCVWSFSVLFVNFCLQVSILVYVYGYVVLPAVRNVQKQYQDFHVRVFTPDGTFHPEWWEHYPGKDELCEIALTDRSFYYCILFCWTMSMLREIRSSEKLLRDIRNLPVCRDSSAMTVSALNGEKTYVVAITTPFRYMVFFLVCIPRIFICVLLLWLGCQWLSATTSFADLVMNSVAMEFVLGIDNVMYDAFLPQFYRDEVSSINILDQAHDGSAEEDALKWTGIYRTFKYSFCAVLYIFLYAEVMQTVLPSGVQDVALQCDSHMKSRIKPLCTKMSWSLNNPSVLDLCYPFGARPPSDDQEL